MQGQDPGGDRGSGSVGLVVHGGRSTAADVARRAAELFLGAGAEVVGCSSDAWTHDDVEMRGPTRFAEGLDLVCSFGGDGTFLRAAYLARDQGVPLIGINLGRLGFLSELEVGDLTAAVPRLAAGDFDVEERMTLDVEVTDADGAILGASWALNEASVERTIPQRLIVLEIRVGDTPLAQLPADAVILATPTGSTAYAFSAGGPILSPLVDAIVLTPVAAHSLFNRTIVVDPAESLAVRPVGGENPCVVSLDGRESLEVPTGGEVRVARGSVPVRMARLSTFDFYARIRHKFGLDA